MRFTLGCFHHFTQALVPSPCSFILVHSLVTNKLQLDAWGMQSNHTHTHTQKVHLQAQLQWAHFESWMVLFALQSTFSEAE